MLYALSRREVGYAHRKVPVIDDLRVAVKHPDSFDHELSPKLRCFWQHYDVVILPANPYIPRHKGRVPRPRHYLLWPASILGPRRQTAANRSIR